MNRAAESFRQFVALLNSEDPEAAAAMMSKEFRWQLHDSGGLEFGRDELQTAISYLRSEDEATVWEAEPIASRGDRWMMARLTSTRVGSGFQTEFVLVGELAISGLVSRAARFSSEEMLTAVKVLDEWAAPRN